MTPELYIKKEYSRYFILAFLFVAPIAGSSLIIARVDLLPLSGGPSYFFPAALQYSLLLFFACMVLPVIIRLHQANTRAKNDINKLQLSMLNTQIKPHFLFNSLNWIYLLSLENARQAPDAILQLSGMMRHIVQEADQDFTDLKKELNYISNYTGLQKGRLGHTVPVRCSVPVYRGSGKIAPLLLMSFIENAFKYGVNPEEDSAIDIDVSITGSRLCLQVINNKVSPAENILPCGHGLFNARQRLQLLYPHSHQLEILEDKKIYSVKLIVAIL
jgi:LytS/YehU family sensor histidine kinase